MQDIASLQQKQCKKYFECKIFWDARAVQRNPRPAAHPPAAPAPPAPPAPRPHARPPGRANVARNGSGRVPTASFGFKTQLLLKLSLSGPIWKLKALNCQSAKEKENQQIVKIVR